MSSKQRFKWIRALPATTDGRQPDYFRYSIKNMRQLPSLPGTAIAGGGATAIISCFVPASSWAMQKSLFIRGWYQLTFPGGPAVPGYSITEAVSITGGGTFNYPIPPPFTATPGAFTTWIERNFIRIDPDIWFLDRGDVMQFNFANFDDNISHVIQAPPGLPPYDFSSQIQIDILATLPGTFPGATLQCMWAEAFLEQGTNLGKLP
jgi:hypothetical protein